MSAASRKKTEAAPAAAPTTFYDKRIIIAAGAKGSSGKSTILLNLVDWYRQMESPPVLAVFDPDAGHRTLTRALHPETSLGLRPPNVFETMDWRRAEEKHVVIDRIVRILCAPVAVDDVPKDRRNDPAALMEAAANKPCISILDGVANQMEDVMVWAKEIDVFALGQELGFRVTLLLCVDDADDTGTSAKAIVDRVGNRADYVIVRNLKHGGQSLHFDISKTRQRVLNEMGGGEITLDGFSKDVKGICEGTVSASEAQPAEPKSLYRVAQAGDRMVMARAFTRWNTLVDQFDRCRHLLLPSQFVTQDAAASH
jgi:hypothetical protein